MTLYDQAKAFADTGASYIQLSNFLFRPDGGILSEAAGVTVMQRRKFTKTDEYRKIRRLMDEVFQRTGWRKPCESKE